MEIVVELYVCKSCQHVELELNGACPECDGEMECVDFVPKSAQHGVQADGATSLPNMYAEMVERVWDELESNRPAAKA